MGGVSLDIGAAMTGWYGCAMLCYVMQKCTQRSKLLGGNRA